MSRAPDLQISFADVEFIRRGIFLDPALQTISDFLDQHEDMIEKVRVDLERGLKNPQTGRHGLTPPQVLRSLVQGGDRGQSKISFSLLQSCTGLSRPEALRVRHRLSQAGIRGFGARVAGGDLNLALAVAYSENNNYGEAIPLFQALVAAHPKSPEFRFNLATGCSLQSPAACGAHTL